MPKIITVRRLEGETEKAKQYIKGYILFPSGLLGLIFMLSGMAALVYQFVTMSYGWSTFLEVSGLLLLGGLLGWAQTRYQQYLLREHPGYFAGRMRLFERTAHKRLRKEAPVPSLEHPGRLWVPVAYILGGLLLLTASTLSSIAGHTYALAAYLLPWAGFFWAKMHFWRGVIR